MPDPDDKTLSRFIAEFVGWRRFDDAQDPGWNQPDGMFTYCDPPDYINSVDAWLRDVMPVVKKHYKLDQKLNFVLTEQILDGVLWGWECSAKHRCLALYRALEGKLSEGK
jgi:hypothetical protein